MLVLLICHVAEAEVMQEVSNLSGTTALFPLRVLKIWGMK